MSEDVKAGRYVAHAAVPVLYVMRGLPGSGKSTRAKELSEYLGGVEVVNRDELRMALLGSYWTGDPDDEAKVSFYERSLVNDNLSKGRSVIVDATHISFASVRAWEPYANEHGARIEVIDVDTSADICVTRNKVREQRGQRFVSEEVIRDMAERFQR